MLELEVYPEQSLSSEKWEFVLGKLGKKNTSSPLCLQGSTHGQGTPRETPILASLSRKLTSYSCHLSSGFVHDSLPFLLSVPHCYASLVYALGGRVCVWCCLLYCYRVLWGYIRVLGVCGVCKGMISGCGLCCGWAWVGVQHVHCVN